MNYIPFHTCFSAISRLFCAINHYSTFSSPYARKSTNHENIEALRILHLITPKSPQTKTQPPPPTNHLRLIQSCIQDISLPPQPQPQLKPNQNLNNSTPHLFDEIPDPNLCWGSLFFQMHKQGIKTEAITLSSALTSCASLGYSQRGLQLHCLAIKCGFVEYVYIGSSLISFYGKCDNLEEAYQVFEEMPVRNVVSWTAIIVGFAHHWLVEMCLELYHRMRCSSSNPNEFTFTAILSACTGSGALGQGKITHCQTIQAGFDSYVHVGNALISMYSKCGTVEEAFYIFERMRRRDLISWNSLISGYSQHGLAKQAIDVFREMEKLKIKPDAITFLGVLSACRHVGFIKQGLICYNSMVQHGVEPDLDHYSCIVDLLGRAGLVEEAKEFIDKMPIRPNAVIWGSLLSSCRLHGNVQIGIEAAENRLLLVPGCVATLVQLVNLYANAGCWEEAARVRKMIKDRGLKTNPGYSWIEIKNKICRFTAEDKTNCQVDEILAVVDSLVDNMRYFGYVPNIHKEGFEI